jgi:hemerythrin-like domain-containing protein
MESRNPTTGAARELPLALAILAQEHVAILQAFDRLEAAVSTEERDTARASLLELAHRHLELEERVFYPALNRAEGLSPLRDRSEEEHRELREALAALGSESNTDGGAVRLARLVFERHRQGEEDELFPLAERKLSAHLAELAIELEQQREASQGAYGVG